MIRSALSATLPLVLLAGCSPVVVDYKGDELPDESDPLPEEGVPDIAVSPLTVDFGTVRVGDTATAEIVVENAGDAPLTGTIEQSGSGAFTLDFYSFELERDVAQVITVTFRSSGAGGHSGQVSILSDDPDEPSVTVTLAAEAGEDADGDGFMGTDDCDDADDAVHPGAEETWYDGVDQDCSGTSDYDADGDGDDALEHGGGDCDDTDPATSSHAEENWYDGVDQDCAGGSDYDQDGDGHDATGYGGDDCDDTRSSTYPGHIEVLENGVDDDCDGSVDEALSSVDTDGDGYAETDGDCLEGDASVHPGADETWYDGVDQDCDGASDYDQDGDGAASDGFGGDDCDDLDATVSPDAEETWYDGLDQDCSSTSDYDQDGDGHDAPVAGGLDCDDTDAGTNPDAVETWYDGVDQDCDGASDYDADGDGFDAAAHGGTDCDDLVATTNPDAEETWYDGVDADCSGGSDHDQDGDGYDALSGGGDDCDDLDATVNAGATETWYDGVDQDCSGGSDYDHDGDGHDALAYGGDDCDELDASVNPSATEAWYDGIDQDCDGWSDYDQDQDGEDGTAYWGTDCDDLDASVNAAAEEVWYDGVDQDCDGADDYDQDGDGAQAVSAGGDDCDDADASVHPSAAEVCDGADDDCDGAVDEGVTTSYYVDADGDGYGTPGATVDACEAPAGYAAASTDCDDGAASVNPGATETCDAVDEDCDGVVDEGLATGTYHLDADGDGYGDASVSITDCAAPSGYVADATDCDDTTDTTSPGADELAYDLADNDCDDLQDEMVAEDVSTWTILGERSSDWIGSGGVYTAEDLDGDGDPELVIGGRDANSASSSDVGFLAFHDLDTAGLDVALTDGWYALYGDGSDDHVGAAFAVVGDTDGAGELELVVGAYKNDVDNSDDGTVYLLDVGGESGTDTASSVDEGAIEGDANNGWTGYALAVGDFDGDGTNEVATGAPGEESGKGEVYVTFLADGFGTGAISDNDSQFWVRGSGGGDHLGYSVAMGDLDADGYDDLVACSPDDDDAGSGSGTCWILVGSSTRDTATNVQGANVRDHDTAVITGGAVSDQLGKTPQSLSVGDFDDDGLDDLAVGMPGYDGYAADGGAVLIYRNGTLSGSETSATAAWLVRGDGALGTAVNMTGDVTGDGVVDLLGGATTAGAADQGVVYLLEGGITSGTWTLPTDQLASWTGAANGDLFGTAISTPRDLDGDGVLDFAVAATYNDDGATDAGKVYVLSAYP